jgi:hypothetical protein
MPLYDNGVYQPQARAEIIIGLKNTLTESQGQPRVKVTYVVVFVIIAASIPFPSLVAPDWIVSVVDASGIPVEGITVRESYQDYSAEFDGGEEDRMSDLQGRVFFPAKKLWASALKRFFVAASEAMGGVHASFGCHDHLMAFGKGFEGDAIEANKILDWNGSPTVMKTRIVLHRTKE